MLATVHIAPIYTAPVAAGFAIVVMWYWVRLGRSDVPQSRRRIRRSSLSIILVTIPVLFGALSLIDPKVRASAYVILWSVAMLCLLLVVVTAIFDSLNSMRLHREAAQAEAGHAAANIMRSLKRLEDVSEVGATTNSQGSASSNGAAE